MRVMKDSGIDWINNVPNSWHTTRLKSVLVERNEKNNPIKTTNLLSLSIERGVFPYSEKTGGGNKAKENFEDYKLAYVDDIVLNSMNVVVGAVGISKYYGCVSPVYYTLYSRNNELYNINYYNYIFQSEVFQKNLWGLGNGIVVKESDNGKLNTIRMRIPIEKLNGVMLPVPSIEEQEKIANFLDEKVQDIDIAIEKTKETIEDYKKLKQNIITKTIRIGIDEVLNTKDSGIEWVGEINENYIVCDFKYILKENMQYGANESGIPYDESLPRYVRITDIDENGNLRDNGKLSLSESSSKGYILDDGDILFARSGGTVGKSFIYKKELGQCAFAGYLIRAKVKGNISPDYVYFYTLSSLYEIWKNGIFIQATIQNIGAEKYMNMPIILPKTLSEQKKIVDYLHEKCNEIDKLIESKEKIIVDLENYKKSVIYEYVTGKKEVK